MGKEQLEILNDVSERFDEYTEDAMQDTLDSMFEYGL